MAAIKRLLEEHDPIFMKCFCPPGVTGMDKMCLSCLAEYEEHMMANFAELEEGGLIMIEAKYEEEIQEQIANDKEK
jgi:hypothetical protein